MHYSGQVIGFGNFFDFLFDLMPPLGHMFNVNPYLRDKLMLNLPRVEVITTTNLLLEFVEAGMRRQATDVVSTLHAKTSCLSEQLRWGPHPRAGSAGATTNRMDSSADCPSQPVASTELPTF
uniref:Uncharacterized protein n=1 Tax=Linum usitatissimum TaxID=4006 RepID=A0A172MLJ5_LINUS|nr:hypothetical protein [Linum usitatissimum]